MMFSSAWDDHDRRAAECAADQFRDTWDRQTRVEFFREALAAARHAALQAIEACPPPKPCDPDDR